MLSPRQHLSLVMSAERAVELTFPILRFYKSGLLRETHFNEVYTVPSRVPCNMLPNLFELVDLFKPVRSFQRSLVADVLYIQDES